MSESHSSEAIAPSLEVRLVRFDSLIDNDSGSGAKEDLYTWRPNPLTMPEGYFYLGPIATNQNTPESGYIVKELVSGMLGEIGGWTQVWNDGGSGKSTDFALWRAEAANPNYLPLASYFTRSYNKPSGDQVRFLKTVNASILGQVIADYEIWNDHGTGATEDGAVWHLEENQDVATPGAFVAVRGYNKPPSPAYGLLRKQIATVQ